MKYPPSGRPLLPSRLAHAVATGKRHRRIVVLLRLLMVVALVGATAVWRRASADVVSAPANLTQTTTVTPPSVSPGGQVTISTSIMAAQSAVSNGVIDLEVYDANNVKVGQQYYAGQSISPGQTITQTYNWTATSAGTYRVAVGVFAAGWSSLLLWVNSAAAVTVGSPVSSTPAVLSQVTSISGSSPANITTTISDASGSVRNGIIDIEVYDANNAKVGQQFFVGQNLSPGQPVTQSMVWTAPMAGVYRVAVGVFSINWSSSLFWANNAATVTVDAATSTAVPPTSTAVPPTSTAVPPTSTAVPPTSTPIPPTSTAVPPTSTSAPPTSTKVPPTSTKVPPTNTAVPPTSTPVPPTSTAVPPTSTKVPPTRTLIPATSTPRTATATSTATPVPPSSTKTPIISTATATPASSGILGYTAVSGGQYDTGNNNNLSAVEVKTGVGGASVRSMSVYVGPIDAGNPGYGLAIYTSDGGSPGALVASASGALSGSGWNTLPIAATLAPNTTYWLVYNAATSNNSLDEVYEVNGAANIAVWSPPVTCCVFPTTQSGWQTTNMQGAIYATLGGPGATATRTATSVPPSATRTPVPSTATDTRTPVPPTRTAVPPTKTPVPLTSTAVPATSTPKVATATSTPIPATATGTKTPVPSATATPSGRLVFDDEFTGPSLNTTTWTPLNRPGDPDNSEQECYLPSNAGIVNGALVLTDKQDTRCGGYSYTSAMVQTKSYHFTYGTFEVRAQMPSGTGQWPALWLLGANCQTTNPGSPNNSGACQWPTPGSDEIDLFETINTQATSGWFSLHTGANDQFFNSCGAVGLPVNTYAGYHTYDLIWQPGSLTWQIDGRTYCTMTQHVPTTPMFPILNIAVGGSFPGQTIDTSVLPQTMSIDYVRVYQ